MGRDHDRARRQTEEPQGKILFRCFIRPEDNVTGHDDMPQEYMVTEQADACAGLVIWGRHKRSDTGKEYWQPNWPARHLVKEMLRIMAAKL